jgi:hypothetical protein
MSRYTPQKAPCYSCGRIVAAPLYLNHKSGKRHSSCILCEEKYRQVTARSELDRPDHSKLNSLWRVTT